MLVDVTSMMASVDSSTFGSGTVSTRTSRLPCQVTAFIATPFGRCVSGLVSTPQLNDDLVPAQRERKRCRPSQCRQCPEKLRFGCFDPLIFAFPRHDTGY